MAQKENRRKVRAILAGGLVLGIGAVLTLASWNDSESTQGIFGTGTLVLESTTSADVEFSAHQSASDLAFTMNPTVELANLSPGDVVLAPFAVKLAEGSTYAATVTINTKFGTNLKGLSYRVFSTGAFGCGEEETNIVVSSRDLAEEPNVGTFILYRSNDPDSADQIKNLCFEVTAGGQIDLSAGQMSTAEWQFNAVQKD